MKNKISNRTLVIAARSAIETLDELVNMDHLHSSVFEELVCQLFDDSALSDLFDDSQPNKIVFDKETDKLILELMAASEGFDAIRSTNITTSDAWKSFVVLCSRTRKHLQVKLDSL